MNRFLIAAFVAVGLVGFLVTRPLAGQTGDSAEFRSKELVVTGIQSHGMSLTSANAKSHTDGVIKVKGAPTLHAVMPSKHMTLDGAALVGHISWQDQTMRDATLSGGVHGTLDVDSKKGLNKITFSGPTVIYADKGTSSVPAVDLDASAPVTFQSVNSTVGSKFTLKGRHGLFHLRTLQDELSLNDADLDGPVSFSFSGVAVDSDGKSKPASGRGTAGHLRITRGGADGTDYELHVSGGITFSGGGGGFTVDNVKTSAATIIVDASGNFQSFAAEDSTSGIITPQKKSG